MPPSTPSMILSSCGESGLSSEEMERGVVPAFLVDVSLLEMLLHHCTSKLDMAKFTNLLFESGETEAPCPGWDTRGGSGEAMRSPDSPCQCPCPTPAAPKSEEQQISPFEKPQIPHMQLGSPSGRSRQVGHRLILGERHLVSGQETRVE